jgi:Methyltransferase small domain
MPVNGVRDNMTTVACRTAIDAAAHSRSRRIGRCCARLPPGTTFPALVAVTWVLFSSSTALDVATAVLHRRRNSNGGIVTIQPVPLRRSDPRSPYALTVSNPQELQIGNNFLSTQVWPAARTAALAVERYSAAVPTATTAAADQNRTAPLPPAALVRVCEFGCGPGLPSLAAAALSHTAAVWATDVDELALTLVREAAQRQQFTTLRARRFDLTSEARSGGSGSGTGGTNEIPDADLFLMSDVFECHSVAVGAARVTAEILTMGCGGNPKSSTVWVFVQSDRSQRDMYLQTLQELLDDSSLHWTNTDLRNDVASIKDRPQPPPLQYNGRLWLCNIDETNVFYG